MKESLCQEEKQQQSHNYLKWDCESMRPNGDVLRNGESVKNPGEFRIAQTISSQRGGRSESSLDRLPAKILENCQRTARVVIISELQKKLSKEKRQRVGLHKILSEFVPKFEDLDTREYCGSKKYYQSLNYSRVRIGHKQFVHKILSSPLFQKQLTQIFDSQHIYRMEKARKNQRSPISFEERKLILEKVLLDYKDKFQSLSEKQEYINESSTFLECNNILQKEGQVFGNSNLPIITVPLKPELYQIYITSRGLTN